MSGAEQSARQRADRGRDARRSASRYRYDWQEVGAAIRLRSGKIFTGVSLDAYLGRMAVCAEAVALGQAITVAGEYRHRHHRRGASSAAARKRTGRSRWCRPAALAAS